MKPVLTGGRRLAALAAVVIAGLAAANPAAAQPAGASFDIDVADVVVAVDGASETSVVVRASEAGTYDDLQATFDFSGLAGIAEPDPGADTSSSCTVSGPVVDCTSVAEILDEGGGRLYHVSLNAAAGAGPGDAGPLTVTVQAAGVDPVTHTATVTVGAAVDLVGDHADVDPVEPGDTVPYAPTVRNDGPEPAEGVTLWAVLSYLYDAETRYDNCTYVSPGYTIILCSFDVVLEPGSTYTLESPMEIVVAADHPAPSFFAAEGRWMTHPERDVQLADYAARGLTGAQGDGPALRLVRDDGVEPAAIPSEPVPAADTDSTNDFIMLTVDVVGDNPVDVAAVGAEATGEVGDEITINVGVENVGAAIDLSRIGPEPSANAVQVAVPDGTTVTSAPEACLPLTGDGGVDWAAGGSAGASEYVCFAGSPFRTGDVELFEFRLRIDEGGERVGTVTANSEFSIDPIRDTDPSNDTAQIVVTPPASGGTGGTGGGTLPVTGGVVATAGIAGLLLLAAGAGAVLLARRRRTHFTS